MRRIMIPIANVTTAAATPTARRERVQNPHNVRQEVDALVGARDAGDQQERLNTKISIAIRPSIPTFCRNLD